MAVPLGQWQGRAQCGGARDLRAESGDEREQAAFTRDYCHGGLFSGRACPVAEACFRDAIHNREHETVAGGMTTRELARWQKVAGQRRREKAKAAAVAAA